MNYPPKEGADARRTGGAARAETGDTGMKQRKSVQKRKKKAPNILDKILRAKAPEVEALQDEFDLVDYIQSALDAGEGRSFRQAITGSDRLALIAEVKKASPSAGVIREDFDPVALAQAYEEAGAAALSVVTERNFFQGRLEFIEQIREATSLPILRKDFITDEYQIAESKLAGADAVLLICSILDWRRVLSLMTLTRRLSMDCLVEVHRPRELDIALIAGAGLIGINNRNLQTLEVNLQTTPRLMAHIHDPIPVVAESGISTPDDLALVKEAGCQAVLVGESLLRQADVKSAIRELFAAEWKEAPGGSD